MLTLSSTPYELILRHRGLSKAMTRTVIDLKLTMCVRHSALCFTSRFVVNHYHVLAK